MNVPKITPVSNHNPFDELISDCQDDPVKIQHRYEAHRSTRNAQSKATLLSSNFIGWQVDEILSKLHAQSFGPSSEDELPFVDPRNNLNFYARPPQHIQNLIAEIQGEIQSVVPGIWLTPPDFLHTTVLEIASSRTPVEIEALASHMQQSGALARLTDYTFHHQARLVKPIVSYDAAAMALSFVPAAGEKTAWKRSAEDDDYTYHHLRRDLYAVVAATGVQLKPRYLVPSAHITIARFITQDISHLGSSMTKEQGVNHAQVAVLLNKIEQINRKVQTMYWPREDQSILSNAEWVVGEETGLEFCKGPCWYGEGEKVLVGKAIERGD
ncbi:uncharacterized protein ACLA_080010 [Aspergillus clavatus NRRL 1]|uniref:RNA ligase/cyclic nucleotide phosphodiesterase n=1 Tax=Aspergillus clavatus (strain ATCC 1007 / CBS 513.65 / DSM 816 / NCTC 3887 / NRRL 1 / QM 1276 / 107) TaxID=344612 RepID=A1CSN0_ASPCL|nr:uncharacterized protein ACLA_080010 [Aspergillus clavatus NRRL 1]EAW06317.1 conserved hypothetical protein [Aspergillus clavatus NRRL 1]